jgi:hypothetical protein
MHGIITWLRFSILIFVVSLAIGHFVTGGSSVAKASAVNDTIPGNPVGLTAEARQALATEDKAFPSKNAGFSAYYRMEDDGAHTLDKGKVDDHIFSHIDTDVTTLRTAPATLVDVGANYTVATLTLENIDNLTSTVNLYYDDEGWIVAYLSKDESSALIFQAKGIDPENPAVEEIGDTILLEAINVVVDEALEGAAIEDDDADLGHYHWQFPNADNFLMMVISRPDIGGYPVQFAVPDTLTLSEISASLWISQGENKEAPCATVTLDDSDLVPKKCAKGIYASTVDLEDLADKTTHTWRLVQSKLDNGGSGSLMIIIYETSG